MLSTDMRNFLLTIALFLIFFKGFSQDLKTFIAAGDKFYSKKDYKHALESFLAAQALNPDDASLNFKIGLTYLYSETKSKAASYIDKAYRLNPAVNPDIDYHLGIYPRLVERRPQDKVVTVALRPVENFDEPTLKAALETEPGVADYVVFVLREEPTSAVPSP